MPKYFCKRPLMMLAGILLISLCVGCYRLSNFGVDAFYLWRSFSQCGKISGQELLSIWYV